MFLSLLSSCMELWKYPRLVFSKFKPTSELHHQCEIPQRSARLLALLSTEEK